MIGDDGRDGEGMTDEPTLLLDANQESTAIHELILAIRRWPKKFAWDSAKVRLGIQCSWADVDYAVPVPNNALWRVSVEEASQIVDLPPSWDCYRKSLTRSMKDNLSYYPRRLTKHGHEFRTLLLRDEDSVRQHVDVLIDMHHKRAESDRGRPHGTHIPTQRHADFLRHCLPMLARQSMLTLALLEVDGDIAAAQAMLESESRSTGVRQLVMYYSGYSAQWHDYSPVTIMASVAIRDAISRGLTHINFLPGEAIWKSRWGATERGTIANIRGLNGSVTSLGRVCLKSTARKFARG
jgi:CelD/BcsL family acetyltransferase involved in cellulose biosynthesis